MRMKTLADELQAKVKVLTWDERYLTSGDPFVYVYYTNPSTGLKQKHQVRKETVLKVRDGLRDRWIKEGRDFTYPWLYTASLRHIQMCIEKELKKKVKSRPRVVQVMRF